MAEPRDYYEILGVAHDADAKTIRNAFRTLALKFHPDCSKEPDAEERFKEIAAAYAVLHDPNKRAEYDARGHAAFADFSPEDLLGRANFEDLFGGLGFDFGGGFFDRLFGRRARPRRGANIEIELVVPLERIATGGDETVKIGRTVACASCSGSGAERGTMPRVCETCSGSGQQIKTQKKVGISLQQITPCPRCGGHGRIIDQPCADCAGRGESRREEALAVRIPSGIEDGTVLRIPGHGMSSAESRVPPGDLFVIVRSAPDARFLRDGADLWHEEAVELVDAVLGGEIRVPTLDGTVTAHVPPGTQPDSTLRLRGKGLPRFSASGYGDLFVRVRLHIPEKLSSRERRLYRELKELQGRSD